MRRRVLRSRQGLVLVSVALIAGVAVPAALTAASGASTPTSTLDHFECYTATATKTPAVRVSFKTVPGTALLKNRFALGGFRAAVGRLQMQCSPAQQTVRPTGVTSSITNADARLVCWTIASKTLRLPATLALQNQFGRGELQPTAARSLCLPSWKNGTAPMNFPSSVAPSNLDSYACFSAIHPAGTPTFTLPASVALKDQFGTVATRIGAANVVCLPTARGAASFGGWTKVVNPTDYSVCFALPPKASGTRTAYDKNQFGTGAVTVSQSTELCVPSVKAAAVPPPSTTTSTPSSPPGGSVWTPSSAAPISWNWQLQGTVPTNTHVQVFDIDGALDQQCNQSSESATEAPFVQANKAVFNAEYQGDPSFCTSDMAARINGALFNLNLDGTSYQPSTGRC